MEERKSAAPAPASARMSRQRRTDTEPEVHLRRQLFAAGLRYRTHVPVPGNPRRKIDVAFPRARVAVFVDGCYWHACPLHASWPKQNAGWWRDKLNRNVARDRETDALLTAAGWAVVRVWEHEDPESAAGAIASLVRQRVSFAD